MGETLKPIRKFNNGRGALLCNTCRTIMATGKEAWEGNSTLCAKCEYDKPSEIVEELTGVIDETYPFDEGYIDIDVNKIDRLEIINHATNDKAVGRLLTLYKELKHFKTLEFSVQDDGKTLKIFLN